MRVIFNEELKAVADDLDHMAQDVRRAINASGEALLNADLDAAQNVLDGDIKIDAIPAYNTTGSNNYYGDPRNVQFTLKYTPKW